MEFKADIPDKAIEAGDARNKEAKADIAGTEFTNDIPPDYSSSVRTMDVFYKNWMSVIVVSAPGMIQPLYTLSASRCGRQLTILDATDQQIGTSTVHSTTSRIDVECRAENGVTNTFEIKNDKGIIGSPRYTSPAFGGQQMTWKNKAMSYKIIYTLVDEQGTKLAYFESAPKSKLGRLELLAQGMENDKINEIMVTLLSLLHRKLQTIWTSNYVAIVT